MNAYCEARCPRGHEFQWRTGTPFVCPVCKDVIRPGNRSGDLLTPRELEVVSLIGECLTNRGIADELVIEAGTVENHLHKIFRKLGLKTRTQVARYAWEHGIIRQEPSQNEQIS